jgi:nicotinate-nucleotide adenylyltransferase
MDEAVEFIKWKEPNTILKLAKFIVFYRPGARKNNLPEMMKKNAKFKEISLSISSTSIRRLIKEGKSIKYLVPTRVEEYIIKKELYNE